MKSAKIKNNFSYSFYLYTPGGLGVVLIAFLLLLKRRTKTTTSRRFFYWVNYE